jgi:poly-gamma-glutamate synthesis protein (capsule biosynthesis protein)
MVSASALVAAVVTLPPKIDPPPVVSTVQDQQAEEPIKVLFVGDIMLDRNVAVHAREVGDQKLFEGAKDLFAWPDALIGNLEGTLTTNPSIAQANHSILRFTFDPHFAEVLSSLGFTAVSLANNHALDFGEFGYDDTVHYLEAEGIGVFGAPFNDSHLAMRTTLKKKNLCLVGYHSLFKSDYAMVVQKITSIRFACDYLIVMAHWGEEYTHKPIAQQREAAHAFIDAGADLIIGAHPHIVEPLEIYKNHAIFYSLGNFLFDQGFSAQVKRGLTVEVELDSSTTRFILTPVVTYKEASVATGATATAVLDDVITPDLAPNS